MVDSQEQKVIKHYQPLIRALIPYEQKNKLLEGLNKFTGRLSASVRKIIKEEVIRLTSLTDAPADNSAFAEFPVFKFTHFGVEMKLDKVGARILHKESQLYQDRYTVGVFETITNSDFYQAHIKKENLKKIVDAFTIETQSLEDIDFGNELAISPNFSVLSPEFEQGRNCSISSLANNTMTLEHKRPPKVSSDELFKFHFPEVPGLPPDLKVNYVVSAVKFNQHTEKYETHFKLHPRTSTKVKEVLEKYIAMSSFQQPLQRELECERAMQDLERDRVVSNSPWVPLFLQCSGQVVTPLFALLTQVNQQHSGGSSTIISLTRNNLVVRLVRELSKYSDAYVLTGSIETKQGIIQIAATLRELEETGILSSVVHLLNANETLQCMQCRMKRVDKNDKQKAFAIHDLVRSDYEELEAISHVVFYKNVSSSFTGLKLTERQPMPIIPAPFSDPGHTSEVQFLTAEDLNRRSEARYQLNTKGSIKVGLLKSEPIIVKDISPRGICIKLMQPLKQNMKELRVTIPDFKLKAQRYEIIGISACQTIVRLKLPTKQAAVAAEIASYVDKNIAFFKSRDTALIQSNCFRFAWELAVRYHPSASVLCVTNRYLINRLKTLYQSNDCADLYPFSKVENVAPLHGFFADTNASKPKSQLLTEMFQGSVTERNVIHCVRKADNKLVFLPENDYLYSGIRAQVIEQCKVGKIELCVTKAEIIRCQSTTSPMTKKRIAQLSRVDKSMYDRFNVMQSSYTHVLYLTSESVLHSTLLRAKLRPVQNKGRGTDSTAAE